MRVRHEKTIIHRPPELMEEDHMPEEKRDVMSIPEAVSCFRKKSDLTAGEESFLNFIEILGKFEVNGYIIDEQFLNARFTGKNACCTMHFLLDDERKFLVMYLYTGIFCDKKRLGEMSRLFTEINNTHMIGNFEFHDNSGEIRYKIITRMDKTPLSGDYLLMNLKVGMSMVNDFYPTIAPLALDIDPPLDKACDEYLKMKGLKRPAQVIPVPDGTDGLMN